MSEKNTPKLVQVTSVDVLLNNDMRITWQGFRPVGATAKNPTKYYTTLPGDGSGSTTLSMVEIGAQSKDQTVDVAVIAGDATLDGRPLKPGDKPVTLGGYGNGNGAQLVFTSEVCSLVVCPRPASSPAPESGAAMARSSEGGSGGEGPPPPYPGGNNNN